MRILVIDDDAGMLNAMKHLLASYGHEVVCVQSAEEGLASDPHSFDFVLLDYKMPSHDGSWFLREAKLGRNTKVLLVTAYANKEVIKTMFSLGVSGYLIKPFDAEDLIRHMEFFSGDLMGDGDGASAAGLSV